jgi:hypothetical protein
MSIVKNLVSRWDGHAPGPNRGPPHKLEPTVSAAAGMTQLELRRDLTCRIQCQISRSTGNRNARKCAAAENQHSAHRTRRTAFTRTRVMALRKFASSQVYSSSSQSSAPPAPGQRVHSRLRAHPGPPRGLQVSAASATAPAPCSAASTLSEPEYSGRCGSGGAGGLRGCKSQVRGRRW